MRRKRLSEAAEDELIRLAEEVNAAHRPGLDPQQVEQATAEDNKRVLEWLDEPRPETAWTWEPSDRTRLALAIVASLERHYVDTGNPAFAWAARRIAREILPHHPMPQWVETYVDDSTRKIGALLDDPPKTDVNDHVAAALGFDPTPGPGRGSPFSGAHLTIRDARLAAEVLDRLPLEGGKEYLAILYVATKNNCGRETVRKAFHTFKSKLN
jgi:hypothetical protein